MIKNQKDIQSLTKNLKIYKKIKIKKEANLNKI